MEGTTDKETQLKTRSLAHRDLGLIIQPCLTEVFATTSGDGEATNP